jgi:hypothetical protein
MLFKSILYETLRQLVKLVLLKKLLDLCLLILNRHYDLNDIYDIFKEI